MIFDVKELQRIEAHSENMVERKLAGAMIAQMNVARAYEAKLLDANRQNDAMRHHIRDILSVIDWSLSELAKVTFHFPEADGANSVAGALMKLQSDYSSYTRGNDKTANRGME